MVKAVLDLVKQHKGSKMKTKHEAWPWFVDEANVSGFNIRGGVYGISEVVGDSDNNQYYGAIRNKEDALLISSAPDLLKAVVIAEKVFRNYGDLHAAKPDFEKATKNYLLAEQMLTAINKATGVNDA